MKFNPRIEAMVNPLNGLPQEIDNLLDHWFGHRAKEGCSVNTFRPTTNVMEHDEAFVISIELPGVAATDVNVEAIDDQLKISGEKKVNEIVDGQKLILQERLSGLFERNFEFNSQVDFSNIQAEFGHGVLTVTVPKTEKAAQKIEIKVVEK